jgi:hypothetical protein
MIKYLDWKLNTDASYTRKALSWEPTPRYHILRRLLFLIEKMKSDPGEWHRKNTTALKRVALRPNLKIYEVLVKVKHEIIEEIKKGLTDPERSSQFPNYLKMDKGNLDWSVGIIFQLIASSVRNNDRMLLLNYIRELSDVRFDEGFTAREICEALTGVGEIICAKLRDEPDLKGLEQNIHDYITLSIQMMVDEVEDTFEQFEKEVAVSRKAELRDIESRISQMETFYKSPDER